MTAQSERATQRTSIDAREGASTLDWRKDSLHIKSGQRMRGLQANQTQENEALHDCIQCPNRIGDDGRRGHGQALDPGARSINRHDWLPSCSFYFSRSHQPRPAPAGSARLAARLFGGSAPQSRDRSTPHVLRATPHHTSTQHMTVVTP